ncbi:MAG: hypothetical protein AAF720_00500 [Pseudomonadota bacterium]
MLTFLVMQVARAKGIALSLMGNIAIDIDYKTITGEVYLVHRNIQAFAEPTKATAFQIECRSGFKAFPSQVCAVGVKEMRNINNLKRPFDSN